jgi:PTS system ascorbate-specific IIA component
MAMLLRELVEQGHCLFIDRADSWQEAVRMSCRPLVEDGTVDADYSEQIIACVERYGPYIVLVPGFAVPHSQEGAKGANRTALSLMKLAEPVSFAAGDPEKDASVFFAVSATDSAAHLKNMSRLFQVLSNDALCAELLKVRSEAELLALDANYLSSEEYPT